MTPPAAPAKQAPEQPNTWQSLATLKQEIELQAKEEPTMAHDSSTIQLIRRYRTMKSN